MGDEVSIEELITNLDEHNIAIHGIHSGSLEEKLEIANSIMHNGLNMQRGWKSILSTAISLDDSPQSQIAKVLQNYQYGYGEKCNIIIRSPSYLRNSQGESIYLGFPGHNTQTASQQYETTCVFDQICSKLSHIPNEFVYGYYTSDGIIHRHANYYQNLSQEKKDTLFSTINNAMSDFSKTISDCVIHGDTAKLQQIKDDLTQKGIHDSMIESALKEITTSSAPAITPELTELSDIPPIINTVVSETLTAKIHSFMDHLPIKRRLFGRSVDEKALQSNNTPILNFCQELNFSDIKGIDDNNINILTKAMNMIHKLPSNIKPDRVLEENLRKDMINLNQPKGSRTIMTDDYLNAKQKASNDFNKCVAAFVMENDSNILQRFYPLMRDMNAKGIKVDLGHSILTLGNLLANRMEELQADSKRGSKAWDFILPHILNSYTLAKEIGTDRYQPQEYKAFEEKLIKLGLIEINKDNQIKTINNLKAYNYHPFKRYPSDKPHSKQPLLLESTVVNEAMCQYINTGMIPLGYKINEQGFMVKETDLETEIRKAQAKKNMLTQYEKEKRERERKEKEKQSIAISINGQIVPTSHQTPSKNTTEGRLKTKQTPIER